MTFKDVWSRNFSLYCHLGGLKFKIHDTDTRILNVAQIMVEIV